MRLKLAQENNLTPLEINIDSMEVINMLIQDNPLYTNILFECRYLIQTLGRAPMTHVFREQNRVADSLRKKGARRNVVGSSKTNVCLKACLGRHCRNYIFEEN